MGRLSCRTDAPAGGKRDRSRVGLDGGGPAGGRSKVAGTDKRDTIRLAGLLAAGELVLTAFCGRWIIRGAVGDPGLDLTNRGPTRGQRTVSESARASSTRMRARPSMSAR
jgi:hypothetical protein